MSQNEIPAETESNYLQSEWCQENLQESESREYTQKVWSSYVRSELDKIAGSNLYTSEVFAATFETELKECYSAAEAKSFISGTHGYDLRPHIFDAKTKAWTLLDSGSMCTAFPPEPGDKPVPGQYLRLMALKLQLMVKEKLRSESGEKLILFKPSLQKSNVQC